jgi:hypothetical protein
MPDPTPPVAPTATQTTAELDQLKAELAKLQAEKQAHDLKDQIEATKRELSGEKPFEHPPTRTDPKVKATFERADKTAKAWNEKGERGHTTWRAHGHIDPATGLEVCELHTAPIPVATLPGQPPNLTASVKVSEAEWSKAGK